ncbi:MAG: hypothetical protein CMA72_09000 [Euryarchaeota archaeon]|nr:hypothetical protein [Euryarchaeota archaeon]
MPNKESKTEDKAELATATSNTDLAVNSAIDLGGVDASDIDIPRINVVQKQSEIDYDVGSVVVDKVNCIIEPAEQGKSIILSVVKKWREDVDFDSDYRAKIANTREEYLDLKSTSDYDVIEWADITLLIKQPEGNTDDVAFPLAIGDCNYAIGVINVAKDAYRRTFKSIATFKAFNRGVCPSSRIWDFGSEMMSRGKYSWFVPALKPTKEKPDEDVATFINSFGL